MTQHQLHTQVPQQHVPQQQGPQQHVPRRATLGEDSIGHAWDAVLRNLGSKEVEALRLVSPSWRDDIDRAVHAVHLVDPTQTALNALVQNFPGLQRLEVTLTHPSCDIHGPSSGTAQHDSLVAASQSVPSSAAEAEASMPPSVFAAPEHLVKELCVYGWAGGCTACGSEPGARGALALPASLLTWAAAPGKLRVLRLSRCAAPAPSSLQECHELRELHLSNVTFASEHIGTDYLASLKTLPHLSELSLLQHEPHVTQGHWPALTDLHAALPALHTFSLAGTSQHVLTVAQQVSTWPGLRSLQLECVSHQPSGHELELQHLMSVMAPGSTYLTALTYIGHTHVTDRCLSMLALLFPSLRRLHIPLDEFALDASWSPFHTAAGQWGPITRAGLSAWIRPSSVQGLRALNLPYATLDRGAWECVLGMRGLEQLDLSGNGWLDDSCLYQLTAKLPRLTHLTVASCTSISDIGVAHLAASLPQLTHLDLSWCEERVTDLGLSRVGALQRLVTLSVAGCKRITDQGLQRMLRAPDRRHGAMKHLNISYCPLITNTGLSYLATSAPNLERLSLDNLPLITSQGVLQLRSLRHLQQLSVAWCNDDARKAVTVLACQIMGNRLGSLTLVPPGTLEAVVGTEVVQQGTNMGVVDVGGEGACGVGGGGSGSENGNSVLVTPQGSPQRACRASPRGSPASHLAAGPQLSCASSDDGGVDAPLRPILARCPAHEASSMSLASSTSFASVSSDVYDSGSMVANTPGHHSMDMTTTPTATPMQSGLGATSQEGSMQVLRSPPMSPQQSGYMVVPPGQPMYALRLRANEPCLGFSPLSEPGRGYERPWWLQAHAS